MSYLPPPPPGGESDDVPPPYGTPQQPGGGPTPPPADPYGTPPPVQFGAQDSFGTPPPPPGFGPDAYGTPPPPPFGQQSSPFGAYGAQYARGPVGMPPANNLVWAILTTILCCLPAGVVSIVFASQVNSKWSMGDVEGATRSAANARTWAIVSAVLAVLFWIFAAINGALDS